MVAMGVDDDEERRLDERPMHQGCMAGFLHLFDRPQILSGRRLHGSHRRLMSSGSSGSATPSERSMPLDRAPSSPDMTPPAAPRPSLQLPPLDIKSGDLSAAGAAPSWRLPRLSLDSRAVVDAKGKLRPREIRTSSSPAPGAPPSPSAGDRRSPSVVARLMGLDVLPHGDQAVAGDGGGGGGAQSAAASPAALRRSASERVPREYPSHFRFVDPAFFERPSSPLPPLMERPSSPSPAPAVSESPMRRAAADPACPRSAFQRRSRFEAHEVFPDQSKRASGDSAAAGAHGGEIALYGEIERRLRKRGIAEPARDLETLKQILEALQLKGLLHHQHTPPPPIRTSSTPPPPPIVVMRPSSHHRAAPPSPTPPARLTPARRLRVDVDRARRPRSQDASPARSPASPARRGPSSPQRRVSPVQSPKEQQPPPFRKPSTSGFDPAAARSRIARRAAQNAAALSPDDEASTTFSDGGSSSSFSASSRWDMVDPVPDSRTDRGLLERCGKLLSSIQAFTGGDAAGSDQQPSPVSVLDAAAFLADEDSPSSSGSKRAIDFTTSSSIGRVPKPAATVSDPEDDEWALPSSNLSDASGDPDYAYVADLVRLFGRRRRAPAAADVYKAAEKALRQRGGGVDPDDDTCCHRRLLCGAVGEAMERHRAACPWDPAAWLVGGDLVDHVWAEVRRAAPVAAQAAEVDDVEDLNDLTRDAIRRDLAADLGQWAPQQKPQRVVVGEEAAEAVLQIERMVFRDLVADTIRELADADWPLPRRKLVF